MIAIYVRQSVDKKDSISIETQIEFCKKELINSEEYKVYQDKGFSGKNINRPAFSNMVKDIEKNKISKLIVYRLDRVSRSITDFANIMDFLEEHKVAFVSANEKFDTSTPVGKAMLYIIMVFAQLERETIAERIKDNYYARGKSGVWLGGPAPFGFEIDRISNGNKKISVLKSTTDINLIKKTFNIYANTNLSLGAIAKNLQNETGQMWNSVKLSRILHNPAYVKADVDVYYFFKYKKCIIINDITEFDGEKGCILYGKRDTGKNKYRNLEEHVLSIGQHKGVIPSGIWLLCQQKLDNNIQIKNTGKGKHTWLSGLIKCGYCNYSMNVKTYKTQKYFTCTGKYIYKICNAPQKTHYVNEIEEFVLEQMKELTKVMKKSDISAPLLKTTLWKLIALKWS